MSARRQSVIARAVARIAAAVIVAATLLPTVAHAQNQTWGGGSGSWFANPNWSSSAGSGLVWSNTSTPRAFFTAGSGTLTLSGSVALTTTFSGTTGGMNFLQSGTWTLSSGTISGRYWVFGASGSSTIKLTLDNIALLRGAVTDTAFNGYNSSAVEVVLGNLAGSTTPVVFSQTGVVSFTVGANTNFGSIPTFQPGASGFSATSNNALYSGTLGLVQNTFASNGYTFSAATVRNLAPQATRIMTITGTGGIATGTFFASTSTGTHTVWTKAGTGFLSVDTLVTSGTQDFSVAAGSMLFNGSSTNLGNLNVASGATLGGTGSLGFAAGRVLTGSAGSFFTADMTAGGLDVLGTLALSQAGSGVTLRLSGLLPTTGTTTLMSWTTLSTGNFAAITYDTGTGLATLTPDLASPALGGGKVSYTAVPNSLVFIPVPEPATVGLLAGGAALLGGRAVRRRRRRRYG